jgi:uncharacterized protein YhjY with autotransporter beta-barrel domain
MICFKTAGVRLAVLGCCVYGGSLQAQTAAPPPPNLTTFVNTPAVGATPLQKNIGVAVQNMCNFLKAPGSGYALTNPTPVGDLFRRCNELVSTAQVLQSFNGARPLGYTQNTQLQQALQQISGTQLSAQGTLTTQVSSGQFSNISGRLGALRIGSLGGLSRGPIADNDDSSGGGNALVDAGPIRSRALMSPFGGDEGSFQEGGSLQPVVYHYSMAPNQLTDGQISDYSTAPATASGDVSGGIGQHWGWFAEGGYNFGHRDQGIDDDAFKFHAGSFTAGIDYNFGSAVLGVSAGYDDYKADFENNGFVSGGEATVKGASGSVYGAWYTDQIFVNGIVTYSAPRTDVDRNVVYASTGACTPACPSVNSVMHGNPHAHEYAAGLSVGHDFYVSSWDFEASASGAYRHVKIDGYTETDVSADTSDSGLALAYGEQTIESFKSIVALSVSRSISLPAGVLTPDVRVEWQHEFKDSPRAIDARYAVDPSPACVSCFVIPSDPPNSNFGVAGAGVTMLFPHRIQAYGSYEALVGASRLTSNAFTLGVRGQF